MRIIKEKKSESSISDTQASSEDKTIDKGKDVNEEGKEINMQSQVDSADQEINCIKLSGAAKIGEDEPENQNHTVVFTRGEALQTINMNQDNYLEEALKMRNLLEEFNEDHGLSPPTILGICGHIFTVKTSFVTIGQRILATPLKVCFQYRHANVFDKIFHIIRGDISKASRGSNLSEDIFAGFNLTLSQGNITHHEYIQVGKGRDVELNQIALFEAKVACSNGEQILSRDIYHLGHRFDFFHMLSYYFMIVGFYVNSMMVVIIVHLFLYDKSYMSLSGLESVIMKQALMRRKNPLKAAMASQFAVQVGLLMALPMVIGLKRGFRTALGDIINVQLQFYLVAKYRGTGLGFVGRHVKFAENYKMYSSSHFTKGLELMLSLIVYQIYRSVTINSTTFILLTASMWFLVVTWIFAPFLSNHSSFDWKKIDGWSKWIKSKGIGKDVKLLKDGIFSKMKHEQIMKDIELDHMLSGSRQEADFQEFHEHKKVSCNKRDKEDLKHQLLFGGKRTMPAKRNNLVRNISKITRNPDLSSPLHALGKALYRDFGDCEERERVGRKKGLKSNGRIPQ
ncbi:hypothetical protein IEQ34_019643 [Dendrobium chrysotoxum]|uniref:Glycosyl transferase 48 domain-containing protein n=1 Tax=Dendrobium chrysotoxum TaxID=161865 RepID=A0AAV7G9G0_DENCH|nr:hypothetical protein IEQ34_019643 [Dendrobium chrysotoxum]